MFKKKGIAKWKWPGTTPVTSYGRLTVILPDLFQRQKPT